MVTYAAPTRGDDGRWLCNVVKSCTDPAEIQASYPCSGCEQTRSEHAATIERKHQERTGHQTTLETLRAEVANREGEPLSDLELLAAAKAHQEVVRLGSEIEALTAAHRAVEGEHTHPVFACAKHASKLPA